MNDKKKIYLKDYEAPAFAVENLNLDFQLHEDFTRVIATSQITQIKAGTDLWLDGEDLKLISISINGQKPDYELADEGLKVRNVPAKFELRIETELKPQENTSLEGLYKSGSIFCTQCEAQGFRKITYFLDRPDVMTKYQVRIEADEKKYPILLSNGDRISQKKLSTGRHEVVWQDPFKKPCYLFALVAGDLGVIKDSFKTVSGKNVDLEIYAAHGQQDRCLFAMESLKKSMRWDEERFGREYDLSTYMIVAIDDFNAGAMENKGLNVFNSRLVFADSLTATDGDYSLVESVIAHEYFHNWTGNRITLRDWFHLSLKEGLTVFRDQEFSMDQSSQALIRIDNVDDLRNHQFAEDAGPNAHPIRPSSCYAVDNFFTSTIYEKGAEVIRMMQTMVGRPGFRKGMDTYFDRFDGQAVVIENFAQAIAEPNQQNWDQFKLWYSQAGTPQVTVTENYDSQNRTYTLSLKQSCPLTVQEKAEGLEKKPFHIPLVLGLLDSQGHELPLNCPKVSQNTEKKKLIHLKAEQESFVFENLSERPVLSLNRDFSAPIDLQWQASFKDLLLLMKHDSDLFNRWDAAQKLYLQELQRLTDTASRNQKLEVSADLADAFHRMVDDLSLDPSLLAKLMDLPSFDYLTQKQETLDAKAFLLAHDQMALALAKKSEKSLLQIYGTYNGKNTQVLTAEEFGRRRLKNKCLSYLAWLPTHHELAMTQLTTAKTMTDQQAALGILIDLESPLRTQAIDRFYTQWKSESLVLNKWFALQAGSSHPDTFKTVQKLMDHPDFNIKNPNRVYSLLRCFGGNIVQFHNPDLDTYSFMADQIYALDKINPQVSSRIASCFDLWVKLPSTQKEKAHHELEKLVRKGLSQNTHEIISKALQAE
ncbi:MAG: aminopeptidase N [Bdellovibrio sp. CG10_big_fil_rev_8_21_14_0_10_47_8]|nr:MAG: aminopeptidase N [Bdellovibrio sp. CG10_big_fil_rev_8_21_14_0_10_47_8]